MSANSYLRVGARYLLQTGEGFDPHLAALFDESDLRYGPDDLDDGCRKVTYEYVSYGKRLGQRLRALGVGTAAGISALEAGVVSWQREATEIEEDIAAIVPMYGLDDLLRDLRQYLVDPAGRTPLRVPENLLYRLDLRALLAALCDLLPSDTEFALTLSELISHSLLDSNTPVCAQAQETLRMRAAVDAPLIVLTEGPSDSRTLRLMLELLYPHLTGLVRFTDFQQAKAQGGAGNLANTVRTFVAAGVINRVLALADNDTAGHEAMQVLKMVQLPANVRIAHLPTLPSLREYPTLGPQSPTPVLMDVNGTAGALEMYLGPDALADTDGTPWPVQWTGYRPKMRRYQGEVLEKIAVQDAFEAQIRMCQADRSQLTRFDWSACHAIFETILSAFE